MKTEILTCSTLVPYEELLHLNKQQLAVVHQRSAARAMAEKLVDHLGPPQERRSDDWRAVEWRWSLAVGDTKYQQQIREAINKEVDRHLRQIATDIYQKAKAEIQHFGSAVGSTTIYKDTAVSFLSNAIDEAIKDHERRTQTINPAAAMRPPGS